MEQPYYIVEYQGAGDNLRLKAKLKKPTKEKCDIQLYYIDDTVEHGIYDTVNNCHYRMKAMLESHVKKHMPGIDRVIFNPPATIVMWNDGTKTVVKASDELFSEEVGLCEAIAKRYFENRSKLKKAIKDAKRPAEGRTDE